VSKGGVLWDRVSSLIFLHNGRQSFMISRLLRVDEPGLQIALFA